MKIAQFGSSGPHPFTVIYTEEGAKYTTLVRLTEWCEVELVPRGNTPEMVEEELALLDKEMEKTIEANVGRLRVLRERKTAILSKVFQPEVT